jgi:hypothetical protein
VFHWSKKLCYDKNCRQCAKSFLNNVRSVWPSIMAPRLFVVTSTLKPCAGHS